MVLKIAYQEPGKDLSAYWNSLRKRNYNDSFDGVSRFIKDSENKMRSRKPGKTRRTLKWILAALIPAVVILSCTKVNSVEPVGYVVAFSFPSKHELVLTKLNEIATSMSLPAMITGDEKNKSLASFRTYVSRVDQVKLEPFTKRVKAIHGISNFVVSAVNNTIRESILSNLSYKIFKMHIDAKRLSDAELKRSIEGQLNSKGIDNVRVEIKMDKDGHRLVDLVLNNTRGDYSIDLSIDDGKTKTVLKEEMTTNKRPPVEGNMTDEEIRNLIKKEHPQYKLSDQDILINRQNDEIVVTIKQGAYNENQLRFKIKH